MTAPPPDRQSPADVQRGCALAAVAFSDGRRLDARLISGAHRRFGLNASRTVVHVPYPSSRPEWTRRSLTCGVALQCAPSKDRVARVALERLSPRERRALSIVEAGVALGWLAEHWPGLIPEARRLVPEIEPATAALDADELVAGALALAAGPGPLVVNPLLGRLPSEHAVTGGLVTAAKRAFGRMPWSAKGRHSKGEYTVPVGGDGGVQNPNLPPPSRPEDDDVEIRPDERVGIPYPEWDFWRTRFLTDHVAVWERRHPVSPQPQSGSDADVRRWFHEPTHRAMRGGLADGSELDVDRYTSYHLDRLTGNAVETLVFRELVPSSRDAATAVLLDGSSSLGAHGGRIFQLELACADALSRAMSAARERHGIFTFTGNTRHRVEVRCLKDFADRRFVEPSGAGLQAAGYTRLGAPLRHLTTRLLDEPAERRLLLVIGDGMISDEGYEGRYAWADVAHAVTEADDAGVSIYYLGIGPARVDPLPEVFGPLRSQRITRVDELPRVLAHVHRELVAA